MLPAIGICLTALSSVGYIAHLLRKAPEGWENEEGFHFDAQPAVRPMKHDAAGTGSVFRPQYQHAAASAIR